MPLIQTAEDAIRRGEEFVSRYYAFKRPLSVKKEGETWLLEFDVGVWAVNRVKLSIDATSGAIVEYASAGEGVKP